MIFKPTLVIIAIILIVWLFFTIPAHPQTLQHRTGPPQTLDACRKHVAEDKFWLSEWAKIQTDFANAPTTSEIDRKSARKTARSLNALTKQLGSPEVIDRACNNSAYLKDFDILVAEARYSVTICREIDQIRADLDADMGKLQSQSIPKKKLQSLHVPHKKAKAKKKLSFTCVSLYRHKYQKDADDLNQPQFLTSAGSSIPCRVVRRSTI